MDNDDLHDNFCDWYKAVHNIKPRWVDPNDRQYILDWISNELRPEVVALRMEMEKVLEVVELRMEMEKVLEVVELRMEMEKVLEEQAWFAEMEGLEEERRLQAEEAREEELEEYYYSLECYG